MSAKLDRLIEKMNWYQSNDPTNNEVYNLGFEMTKQVMILENWVVPPADIDNVAREVAADIYMKVAVRGDYINYWQKFISIILRTSRVPRCRKVSLRQVFDTNYDPVSHQELVSSYISCKNPMYDVEKINNSLVFQDTFNIIDDVIKESKFQNDIEKMLPLYVSVALSLRDNKIVQWHTDDELKPYVNILVAKVIDTLTRACQSDMWKTGSIVDSVFYRAELSQYDSKLMKDRKDDA